MKDENGAKKTIKSWSVLRNLTTLILEVDYFLNIKGHLGQFLIRSMALYLVGNAAKYSRCSSTLFTNISYSSSKLHYIAITIYYLFSLSAFNVAVNS